MNKILAAAVVMVAAAGCVPGNGPIRILGTYPYDGCAPADDFYVGRGSINLAGAGTYYTWLRINNESVVTPVSDHRGNALTGTGATNFMFETLNLSYTSTPRIAFETESVAQSGVIGPNSEDNNVSVNLIGPKALETLRGSWTEDTTLLVTFSLKGHLESGTAAQSNPYTFPIVVRNPTPSALPCESPKYLLPTGPCGSGGGQDGSAVVCCSSAADPGCSTESP